MIASLNGAGSLGTTVAACAAQADTYVVSDGSTDGTYDVAKESGATTVLQLDENVGKPAAIYNLVTTLGLCDKYDLLCIVDDDTIVARNFVAETSSRFSDGIAVVCAKTISDWNHKQRWNYVVAGRAFSYWKYQAFLRRGQSALGVMNCISGSNSVYTSDFLRQVLRPDTPYVVDDTYWVLEAQRKNLGKIVYDPYTSASIQEPTTLAAWYKQNLRWLHGTMQGIRGHRVGRRFTKFDLSYIGMMIDWLTFIVLMPFIIAFLVATNIDNPDRLKQLGIVYLLGYAAWATVGAIALRKWRLMLLFPLLLIIDWASRVNFIHAFCRTIKEPTSSCKWESPERYETVHYP